MNNYDINKLIGIPFKLNHKDFSGCDCRGIVCLYYENVKNRIIPFTDGKRIFLRNRNKDSERIKKVLETFSKPISFKELAEGDIVVLKVKKTIGALGVCINNHQLLHMDRKVGSCLTRLSYLKELFLFGYRSI